MTKFEYEDYREPQKPKLGPWPFWEVPEFYAFSYIIRLSLILLIMPYLFGIQLSALGLFFIFVLFDYFTYFGLKKAYGLE